MEDRLLRQLMDGESGASEALEHLIDELDTWEESPAGHGRDVRMELLDALEALGLLYDDDPSYPWQRGGLLKEAGRFVEAAHAYLDAASRSRYNIERNEPRLEDEEEWHLAALYIAAQCFAEAGYKYSASVLLSKLPVDDRTDLAKMIINRY